MGSGRQRLRERLGESPTPQTKLYTLETFLLEAFATRLSRNKAVDFALSQFGQTPVLFTVKEVARQTAWCMRHFSQVFRQEVGLTPKVWCRVQRFQQAVQQLHTGVDVRWAELAQDCGYYDQSHFANEFRAFSGIDATSYSARRTRWPNHIPEE